MNDETFVSDSSWSSFYKINSSFSGKVAPKDEGIKY